MNGDDVVKRRMPGRTMFDQRGTERINSGGIIMSSTKSLTAIILIVMGICVSGPAGSTADKTVEIHLSLAQGVSNIALSGRVYVFFDRNIYGHPLDGPDASAKKPFFAMDAENWKTGKELLMTNEALGFPCALDQLPAGSYAVQALLDTNTVERDFADAPGNISGRIFSGVVVTSIRDGKKNVIDLCLENKAGKREFEGTAYIKEIKLESRLLSAFWRRPTTIRAAVILPPSYYEDTTRKYGTVYVFPAFGRRYYSAVSDDYQIARVGMNMLGLEKVFVFLDQTSPFGCHVFANSENNGFWATAFIEELLPYVERNYRVYPEPKARFLTGQSSGAWAGLWLQINYPEQFAGVWAASPDPVDFSSFLGVNIYEPGTNLLFTKNGDTLAMNKLLADFDRVAGTGWQMGSFDAAFSPRGTDGQPRRMWDRATGAIDSDIAQTWKKYDIRLILENNWAALAPGLEGKIHIYVADNDRFGLAGPVKSLQEAMTRINANVDINIYPKGGHDLWSNELRKIIHQQVDAIVLAGHPEAEQAAVSK